jgi:hypothetical protein
MQAEIDGELGSEQRRELAQRLLADPHTRHLRDQLRSACQRLDALGQVEPPAQLERAILSRLPQRVAPANRRWPTAHWRLAALVAGVLTSGALVYQLVQGPGTGSSETAGTMVAGPSAVLDTVSFANGPLSGRASLYREQTMLALALEVSAATGPVDVLITGGGHSFRINGLDSKSPAEVARRTITLPGVPLQGEDIELTLLIGGLPVQRTTLHAPTTP